MWNTICYISYIKLYINSCKITNLKNSPSENFYLTIAEIHDFLIDSGLKQPAVRSSEVNKNIVQLLFQLKLQLKFYL